MTVAHQRKTGFRFHDLKRFKLDGLEVTGRARRFHTECFELLDDVCLCRALTAAAGITALESVVREHRHGVPPGLAIEVLSGLGCAGEE
jgi:hypothetical protein